MIVAELHIELFMEGSTQYGFLIRRKYVQRQQNLVPFYRAEATGLDAVSPFVTPPLKEVELCITTVHLQWLKISIPDIIYKETLKLMVAPDSDYNCLRSQLPYLFSACNNWWPSIGLNAVTCPYSSGGPLVCLYIDIKRYSRGFRATDWTAKNGTKLKNQRNIKLTAVWKLQRCSLLASQILLEQHVHCILKPARLGQASVYFFSFLIFPRFALPYIIISICKCALHIFSHAVLNVKACIFLECLFSYHFLLPATDPRFFPSPFTSVSISLIAR